MLQHGVGHHEGSPAGQMALGALQLAHGFADNGGAPTAITILGTDLVAVTVTPKVSGKFKLSASVVAHNSDDSNHFVGLQFGHAPVVADYPGVTVPIRLGSTATDFVGLEAINGAAPYPFVAPLGVPITFFLIASADANGVISVPAGGGQLTVEELPN